MLRDNEERLRASSFEMVLSQLPLLPIKYVFGEPESQMNLENFDNMIKSMKIDNMTFERIEHEFQDSINQLQMVGDKKWT